MDVESVWVGRHVGSRTITIRSAYEKQSVDHLRLFRLQILGVSASDSIVLPAFDLCCWVTQKQEFPGNSI